MDDEVGIADQVVQENALDWISFAPTPAIRHPLVDRWISDLGFVSVLWHNQKKDQIIREKVNTCFLHSKGMSNAKNYITNIICIMIFVR